MIKPPIIDKLVNIYSTTPHKPFEIHVAIGPVTIKATGIETTTVTRGTIIDEITFGQYFLTKL